MKISPDKKRILDNIIYAAVILIGAAVDQLTKLLAVKHLKGEPSVTVIKGFFSFSYVENTGAAFGMMKDSRWIFMTVSAVAIIAMTAYLFSAKNMNKFYTLPLSLIISGGIGNMIDRTARGYVVDLFEFDFIDFPVFNFADSLVCVGAALLVIALIVDIAKEAKEAKKK